MTLSCTSCTTINFITDSLYVTRRKFYKIMQGQFLMRHPLLSDHRYDASTVGCICILFISSCERKRDVVNFTKSRKGFLNSLLFVHWIFLYINLSRLYIFRPLHVELFVLLFEMMKHIFSK